MLFIQDQYKFIYDTLEEYCRGIDSRFPVSELANKIKEKTVKDQKLKKNAYALEYAVRLGPVVSELSTGLFEVFLKRKDDFKPPQKMKDHYQSSIKLGH